MIRNCIKIVCSCLIGTLSFSACISDLQHEASHERGTTVGIFAGGTQTKTTMLSNGLSAAWESGDQIAVWAKASAGSYTLSNQTFVAYGIDASRGFFTSELASEMPDDTYTYYSCYPSPVSVNGTQATFAVPAVQDGLAGDGADIMISTPNLHGPLVAIPDVEDHSGMSISMNRMMHQFRFYVPEEDQLLGDEKIERILLSFPTEVTGNVTLDVADLSVPAQLSDGRTDVVLNLEKPIGVSAGEQHQYACLAFVPVQFAEGESLKIVKAYTDDKIAFFDPIDLRGKNCLPGHSTPVRLNIREIVDYAGIIYLKVASNNLGENPRKITFTAPEGCSWGDGGTNVLVYEPGREILVGETVAVKFETDVEAYKAFSNKEISVVYDSDNALMSETFTMPAIESHGSVSVSLTVPYLLYEDFSCLFAEGESYGDNDYDSEDRNQPGSSLDEIMYHTGWNAARYWAKDGSIRINTRYQCVSISILSYTLTFASYHYGRLDTPQLTGLKPGKTVNLKAIYDAGGNLHSSSSVDIADIALCVATHENTGVLDGIPTGSSGVSSSYETSLSDFGSRQDSAPMANDFGDEAFGVAYPTQEATIGGATSSTRLVFYTIFTGSEKFACNAEFNVYMDNIRVQIAK